MSRTIPLSCERRSAPRGAFFVCGGERGWRSGGFAEDAGSTRPPGADADGRRPAPERAARRGEAQDEPNNPSLLRTSKRPARGVFRMWRRERVEKRRLRGRRRFDASAGSGRGRPQVRLSCRVGRSRAAASPTIPPLGGAIRFCASCWWVSRLRRCDPPYALVVRILRSAGGRSRAAASPTFAVGRAAGPCVKTARNFRARGRKRLTEGARIRIIPRLRRRPG